MSSLPEEPTQAPSFVPQSADPVAPADTIVSLTAALGQDPSAVDLVVSPRSAPAPLGRSWAFDWKNRKFVRGLGRSPVTTFGLATLEQWIAKALSTARDAHPASPRGYGLPGGPMALIGGNVGQFVSDPAQLIHDTLTFHPRISDVTDVTVDFDPDDTWVRIGFLVHVDGGSQQLSFPNLRVAL